MATPTSQQLIEWWRFQQDRAADEMRLANQEPAWRKGARARFDIARREWLAAGEELLALGDIR